MALPVINGATPADDVARFIDRIRRTPAQRDVLVDLLAEQSPVYAGRSTNEAERLRGYLLASFETVGLPAAAFAYVREELETGQNPYTVAAAARALRGADAVPGHVVPLLLAAIQRIAPADDAVCFDRFCLKPEPQPSTTALMELVRTLAWLGPRAANAADALRPILARDPGGFSPAVRAEIEHALAMLSCTEAPAMRPCCSGSAQALPVGNAGDEAAVASPVSSPLGEDIRGLELQDQDGTPLTFGVFFHGRPSIITFFYTRCMNPEKCSRTITKLAGLQRRIAEQGLHGCLNVAAMTYDPAFDLPNRLRAYGFDRGMSFDERNRLLRTTGPFDPVQRHFDLGVGYGSVTVNRHRLELVVLDRSCRIAASFTRALWDEDEVLGAARAAL